MKAVRLGLLLCCALVAACSEEPVKPPPTFPAAAPNALARLKLAQGKVELARDGKPARAADIEDLFDQDLLITGLGGRAIIRFKSGGELELSENSRFRLTQNATNLDLSTGNIILLEGDGD